MKPTSDSNPSSGDRETVVADLVEALRQTHRLCDTTGNNLPELFREALERLGREVGGVEELVRHRPGSWEAEHVRRLAAEVDLYPEL
jgi:hypothetical protein